MSALVPPPRASDAGPDAQSVSRDLSDVLFDIAYEASHTDTYHDNPRTEQMMRRSLVAQLRLYVEEAEWMVGASR